VHIAAQSAKLFSQLSVPAQINAVNRVVGNQTAISAYSATLTFAFWTIAESVFAAVEKFILINSLLHGDKGARLSRHFALPSHKAA